MKQRLLRGESLFGTFVKVPSPAVIEVIGLAGFDFILIDQEHGTLSHTEAEGLVRTAQGMGMRALVRVPDATKTSILHALDTGADGIVVPAVESADVAARAVAEAHYPPRGMRGFTMGHRAGRFGFAAAPKYLEEAAANTLVCVQIETAAGLANVEEIAATPGVDMLFVGPQDLSLSLGVLGQSPNPTLEAASQRVYETAARHGLVTGTMVTSPAEAEAARRAGVQLITWGSELGLLGKAAREARAAWTKLVGE